MHFEILSYHFSLFLEFVWNNKRVIYVIEVRAPVS